jgi:two-component system, cell cycle response regulator DivK
MKRRILVVEDNLTNCELLCDWLAAEGFEPLVAANLHQAYAAFENQPPHAVLLDVQLGAEDGLSLAAWIRREFTMPHIPVIAVTAHAMLTDREKVIQAGCDACVPKPVDFKLLRSQLEQWLAGASSFQPDIQGKE